MEVTGVDMQKTCTRVKYLLCRALYQSPYGAQQGACPPIQEFQGQQGTQCRGRGPSSVWLGKEEPGRLPGRGGWSEKGNPQ